MTATYESLLADIRTRWESRENQSLSSMGRVVAAVVKRIGKPTTGKHGALKGKQIVECYVLNLVLADIGDHAPEGQLTHANSTTEKKWLAVEEAERLTQGAQDLLGITADQANGIGWEQVTRRPDGLSVMVVAAKIAELRGE